MTTTTDTPTTTGTPGTPGTGAVTVNADDLDRALKLTAHGVHKGTRGGLSIHRGVELRLDPSGLGLRSPHPSPDRPIDRLTDRLTLTTFDGTTSVRAVLRVDPPAPDSDAGSDAESAAESTVGALAAGPASVVVEHAHLRAALKGLPRRAHVALAITNANTPAGSDTGTGAGTGRVGAVTLTTPAGVFTLPAIGEGRFPFLPTPADEPGVIGPAGLELFATTAARAAAGFKAVRRSASTDATLPVLCGLAVHVVPGQPVAVEATDRYRYSRWDTGYETGALWDGPALPRPRLVLPARPVAALAVTLARAVHPGSVVSLSVDGAGVAGRGGWATVSTVPLEFAPASPSNALAGPGGLLEVRATFALTDADYPRVQALWPAGTAYTAQVDAPALALSLARAVGLSGPRSVIGLRLAPEEVTVTANPAANPAAADDADDADEGAADIAGTTGAAGPIRQEVHTPAPGGAPELTEAPEVGMTPAFLADTLAAFGGTVTIGGTDDRKPWTFTDEGPVRVLLMPNRLDTDE